MFANLIYLGLLIGLAPLLLFRAVRHGRYRQGWPEKLLGTVPLGSPAASRRIWLHAVSVGEVNLLRNLVERLQQEAPDAELLISCSTDSGHELAGRIFAQHQVFFAPLDFSWGVRRALRRLQPDLLILAELEIWPNWIKAAARQGVPIAVINGRLSARSHRGYRRVRRWMAPTFQRLTVVCCQNGASRERFLDLGVPAARLCLTGSMKYDDAPLDRETAEVARCRQLAGIQDAQMIWLAGSTAPGEEAMALRIYQRLSPRFPQFRLILVPRHRERFDEVAEEIARAGLVCRRRRALTETTAAPAWDRQTVLLIDTIGELKAWWGTSQLAFVGGSFGRRGGQNMLEPCGYGSAVAFGPSTRNFRDIVRGLKTAGGAVEVADEAELAAFVERGLSDRRWAETLGQAAQTLIRQHRGATERTIAALPLAPPALPAETARLDTQQTGTDQAGTDQAGTDQADQPRAA